MRNKLISGVAGAAFSFAASGLALAADMAVKAPPPPPPAPISSWTGFYVGAELGGEWADTTWTTTLGAVPTGTAPPFFFFDLDASSPRNYDLSAPRFGGYLGYNWQFAPQWVTGVEFDGAYANKTDTAAGVPGCSIGCGTGHPGPAADRSSVKMGWDASLRARLGYLVSPNLLAYGTAGVAWQQFEASATCQFSPPDPICDAVPGNPFATATESTNRTGWTIGGGLEARLYGNWLVRGEYRYSDFGTWNNSFTLTVPGVFGATYINSRLRLTTQIATVGIAYQFGEPTPAVAAGMVHNAPLYKAPPVPPAPIYNWTGWYVGGNVGEHWSNDRLSTVTTDPNGFFAAGGPAAIDAASPTTLGLSGFMGGLQAGYNWQFAQYVAGIEGDFNWLTGSSSRRLIGIPIINPGDFETNADTANWLATIRPRLGTVFFDPRFLIYVTGGVAFAQIKTSDLFGAAAGGNLAGITTSTTRTGWTLGGGVEYAFLNNWSVKAEYLYADLGNFSAIAPTFAPGPPGAFITYNHKYTENIARVGLNYQFH